MGLVDDGGRRYFGGIGVGSYDDPTLDLPRAEADVREVAAWFTERSGRPHTRALERLGKSPAATEILETLSDFLDGLTPDDVVVIYMACHGEFEGGRAYLYGRNSPRTKLHSNWNEHVWSELRTSLRIA